MIAGLTSLLTGKWALPVAAGIAVVPSSLGLFKPLYAISIGYGLSVASVAGAALLAGPGGAPAAHSLGVVAHGVRLAGFLWIREREILSRKKDGAEYKKKNERDGQQKLSCRPTEARPAGALRRAALHLHGCANYLPPSDTICLPAAHLCRHWFAVVGLECQHGG
mmetsp:Transcript_26738/g.47613  ORF Transcript_26738/g.47613 Transcript_26738/m.47613 type:complete len:165 (-) Transcript_26738:491-985(-)